MRYAWAVESHVGRVRRGNEDSLAPTTDGAGEGPVVIAVADGMGGHVAGEVASHLAIEAAMKGDPGDVDAHGRVSAANEAVAAAMRDDPDLSGMGTTLTLGIFRGDGTVQIGHVGDSRAYLLRNGELRQITTDHTLVARLVADGHISESEARTHPRRHLVMQSIGMHNVDIEEAELQLEPGDRVLLCTDGLNSMIDDEAIAGLLADASPAEAAWRLIDAANAAGGYDNTTVAVVDVTA
ncbi:MAG TPA: protein phosphatase 2C domain-containing protein [Acidimicrobiia bacterium]|nr:protein phosphatase 2C domain-containing protein [Acidimicrobiia bacterium]